MDTTLTIKLSKKLRDETKRTAKELGIPLTTAVHGMFSQFVKEKELLFSAKVPNAETRRALRELRARKNTETFDTIGAWKKSMRKR